MSELEKCHVCNHEIEHSNFEYRHKGNSYCCLQPHCICINAIGRKDVVKENGNYNDTIEYNNSKIF